MKLYVVKMHRWGDLEAHSYIEGVYESLDIAKLNGKAERMWRDNKYEPEIIETILNASLRPREEEDL